MFRKPQCDKSQCWAGGWWRGRQQLYFCLQSTEQKTKKLQFDAINNNKIPSLCGGGAIFQPSIMTTWTWADCVFEIPWVITPDPSVAQSVIKLVSWQQGVLCVQAFFRLQFSVCLESASRLTKNSDSHWSLVQPPAAAYVRCIHSNWKRPRLWQIFQLSLARVHECLA